MSNLWQGPLEKIDDYRFRIPKSYKKGMRVDGIIYADDKLIASIRQDKAMEQVSNVAFLPGIVGASLAMPDIHWGYGFPIGGVAATDIEEGGVVSPGGVGFDINCGIRLLRTDFTYDEIKDKISSLVAGLFSDVPSGVGSKGDIRVSRREEKELFLKGARWAVAKGFGVKDDLECTEEYGAISGADPDAVSDRAYERGKAQSGTLGSGNHFLELQVIDQVYDQDIADAFGLRLGQLTIMIHSGSRGLGYQVCDDYSRRMIKSLSKYNINVPDRQLACAPVKSIEGRQYLGAMRAAANYAWVNRQCLMYRVRKVFEKTFSKSWQNMGMSLIYDVAHNIAKIEKHVVNGKNKELCVHRKGATRAFGPDHPELPDRYKKTGQPVIIPGDMGRNSYLLVGTKKASETFYSACHGAGRVKSRTEAARTIDYNKLLKTLESKGIIVRASGRKTIVEEAPDAYKDVNDVVGVIDKAGISKKVVRMRPLGV
ncbi:MAG TPA: RtcB family protein, partial [Candidatus Omnitrophica bacterium]|nr:RtcB family protein [Candidatus Omnitrophota bacterium]